MCKCEFNGRYTTCQDCLPYGTPLASQCARDERSVCKNPSGILNAYEVSATSTKTPIVSPTLNPYSTIIAFPNSRKVHARKKTPDTILKHRNDATFSHIKMRVQGIVQDYLTGHHAQKSEELSMNCVTLPRTMRAPSRIGVRQYESTGNIFLNLYLCPCLFPIQKIMAMIRE